MKSVLRQVAILAALCLTTASSSLSQEAQDPLGSKVDSMFAEFDHLESPGWAVLAVRRGEVVLRRGYGMANLEHQRPITASTVFDIASVSKQFAAMAISILVEQGVLSLDDDVRQYVPELPEFGHTITIRHLVHHTSGLRDWPGTLAVAGWRMDDVISFDQILTMAFNQQGLNFEPGSEYSYSNTGYNVLAEVVTRVTGQTFREWTDANIFKPLGMTSTHFHDDHTELVPNRAYGYARDSDGQFHAVPNGLTALGSSSLYTTIDDLAKWVINFEEKRVGGAAVIDRMMQRGVLNDGTQLGYAFGLGVGRYRGLRTISHSGSWASFRTFLVHFPEQHFSVVVLGNHSPSDPNRAAYDLVDLYLADELSPRAPPPAAEEQTEPSDIPAALLDEYVGTYRLGPAWYVKITRSDNGFMTQATAEDAFPMEARSDSVFWVPDYGAAMIFLRDDSGRVDRFRYRGMICPRVADLPPPSAEQLTAYEGEYFSEELSTAYVVAVEQGELVLRHRRHGVISLTPAWSDDFRGGQWFLQSVEFDRGASGRVAGFRVTQSRSRNLRFVKRN
ncbi:MAG: serine hydrolase [Gemmatimonadota bacterium]|nr:MAG: serine hydrolase [Gemmatimonadota bacterium]